MEEYKRCADGIDAPAIKPGADRFMPGTFDDLIARWYASSDFEGLKLRTRTAYRNDIERWRAKYGRAMVRDLRPQDVQTAMQERLPHKTSANNLRKRLGQLMRFANTIEYVDKNPVLAIKPYKIEGEGYHSWTDDEIAKYEATHPVGTKARLMFDLLLWTGQRRGDVRTLGPVHIQNGRLIFYQEKGDKKHLVDIPILQPLAESILATETGRFCFLISKSGTPYGRDSIGNYFREWCNQAGLKHCTAHGMRKAAARRFAEAGCTNQEIKSWTGHSTDSEVARYTKAASNKMMADAAAVKLLANLATELDKNSDKLLKGRDN